MKIYSNGKIKTKPNKNKNLIRPGVGEHIELLELSYIAFGKKNVTVTLEKEAAPHKLKHTYYMSQ